MKKIICIAAGLLLAASTASAVTVGPKSLRSFGDEINEGFVWSIGGISAVGWPICTASGKLTIQGAAYIGALNVGGFPTGEESNFLHDMGAMVIFDAQELKNAAPTGTYTLELNGLTNFGYASLLNVAIVPDAIIRNILQGGNADGSGPPVPRGPFPAGFQRIHEAETSNNGGAIIAEKLIPFAPVVTNQSIPLCTGSGSGNLDVCLGPTGQVRIIDPGNNGDWATECVANGWRAATIGIGAGCAFGAAVDDAIANNAQITTCKYSCSPVVLATDRNQDCSVVIDTPLAIIIVPTNGAAESDRGGAIWQNGVLGGNNFMASQGADEAPLATINIVGS